ncbi:MAG: hypothetical protein MHM6MM_006661, partial [Cercozoa sp. M6MM]
MSSSDESSDAKCEEMLQQLKTLETPELLERKVYPTLKVKCSKDPAFCAMFIKSLGLHVVCWRINGDGDIPRCTEEEFRPMLDFLKNWTHPSSYVSDLFRKLSERNWLADLDQPDATLKYWCLDFLEVCRKCFRLDDHKLESFSDIVSTTADFCRKIENYSKQLIQWVLQQGRQMKESWMQWLGSVASSLVDAAIIACKKHKDTQTWQNATPEEKEFLVQGFCEIILFCSKFNRSTYPQFLFGTEDKEFVAELNRLVLAKADKEKESLTECLEFCQAAILLPLNCWNDVVEHQVKAEVENHVEHLWQQLSAKVDFAQEQYDPEVETLLDGLLSLVHFGRFPWTPVAVGHCVDFVEKLHANFDYDDLCEPRSDRLQSLVKLLQKKARDELVKCRLDLLDGVSEESFKKYWKHVSLSQDQLPKLSETLLFLKEALPELQPSLLKQHLPALFLIVRRLLKDEGIKKIRPTQKWFGSLFEMVGCSGFTLKARKWQLRLYFGKLFATTKFGAGKITKIQQGLRQIKERTEAIAKETEQEKRREALRLSRSLGSDFFGEVVDAIKSAKDGTKIQKEPKKGGCEKTTALEHLGKIVRFFFKYDDSFKPSWPTDRISVTVPAVNIPKLKVNKLEKHVDAVLEYCRAVAVVNVGSDGKPQLKRFQWLWDALRYCREYELALADTIRDELLLLTKFPVFPWRDFLVEELPNTAAADQALAPDQPASALSFARRVVTGIKTFLDDDNWSEISLLLPFLERALSQCKLSDSLSKKEVLTLQNVLERAPSTLRALDRVNLTLALLHTIRGPKESDLKTLWLFIASDESESDWCAHVPSLDSLGFADSVFLHRDDFEDALFVPKSVSAVEWLAKQFGVCNGTVKNERFDVFWVIAQRAESDLIAKCAIDCLVRLCCECSQNDNGDNHIENFLKTMSTDAAEGRIGTFVRALVLNFDHRRFVRKYSTTLRSLTNGIELLPVPSGGKVWDLIKSELEKLRKENEDPPSLQESDQISDEPVKAEVLRQIADASDEKLFKAARSVCERAVELQKKEKLVWCDALGTLLALTLSRVASVLAKKDVSGEDRVAVSRVLDSLRAVSSRGVFDDDLPRLPALLERLQNCCYNSPTLLQLL